MQGRRIGYYRNINDAASMANPYKGGTMSTENNAQDPMEFMRSMWSKMGFSLPGMVTPTLDVDELDKRIADMKAVENWLKMNLNSLQMATQGRNAARHHCHHAGHEQDRFGRRPQGRDEAAQPNPFASGMWPWNLMQNAAEQSSGRAAAPTPAAPAKGKPKESK
jgi:hypothetical protein